MNQRDMDFIIKFTQASSAAVIIASCLTGCVYGPPANYGDPWDGDQGRFQEVEIPQEE